MNKKRKNAINKHRKAATRAKAKVRASRAKAKNPVK
jgi:hypothetical protein